MLQSVGTTVRTIRLSDDDWALAQALADDLARELSGSLGRPVAPHRSDAIRLALREAARNRGVSLTPQTTSGKTRKSV